MNRLKNKGERAVHAPVASLTGEMFELAKDLARKEDETRQDSRAAHAAIVFNQAATIERLRFQIAILEEQLAERRT